MSMVEIQQKLKAPKGQTNSFGGYQYRSCEDIVEAVKPILHEMGLYLSLTDGLRECGGRVYVEAVAAVMDGEKVLQASTAYAREPMSKKGFDESQITGAASSYARKYALNGLFAIDDTKDADTDEHAEQVDKGPKPEYTEEDLGRAKDMMLTKINSGERTTAQIISNLRKTHTVSKDVAQMITNLGNGTEETPPH